MRPMRVVLLLLTLVVCRPGFSQRVGQQISIPPSTESANLEWVDFNNDALLDIMLLSKNRSGKDFLNVIQGTEDGTGLLINKSIPIINYQSYVLSDYNRDNKMDLLVSGTSTTALYVNRGDFTFEERMLSLPPFLVGRFADLDNNALPELIVSGTTSTGYYLRILKQQSEFGWIAIHDSLSIKCSSIETFDADGDGDVDLFTSGELTDGSLTSGFLMNEGSFKLKPHGIFPFQGKTTIADTDGNGVFEVILMGVDQGNEWSGKKIQWSSDGSIISDLPIKPESDQLSAADFDFDGTVDIHYLSQLGYQMVYGDGEQEIELNFGYDSKFGDFDHDGKLDAMDLDIADDSKVIFLLKNNDARNNLAPGSPKDAVALPIFNRVFMYWQKPTDDLTPQASLTYDLFFQVPLYSQASEFDLSNQKRLTVTHGNNGTNNFKLFKNVSLDGTKYFIQAVDNSFHAGSLCIGESGGCGSVSAEEIVVCTNVETKFTAPPDVLWFSFARGFLGKADELNFATEKNDTIFYYNPGVAGCAGLKVWTVKADEPDLKVSFEQVKIFKGGDVQLQAAGAQHFVWTPDVGLSQTDIANPIASPLSTITYTVVGYNAEGCASKATVTVVVDDTSFIPTLFSPNDDGQNDQLKIYGLQTAADFTFSVFDREGSLVYKTSNVAEAVQQGWDGTRNGTKLPTGVYFWKVTGKSSTGTILLNGKESGSVVLIR